MARFVVEPAVAVKWFVPEDHSSPAARLLDRGNELFAPDTILTEAAGIITAKIRLDEIRAEEGAQVVEALRSVPLRILCARTFLDAALDISAGLDVPFRDGMGLAAAVQVQCRLVTAGRTLYDKVQGTSFARHVKWVGDLR